MKYLKLYEDIDIFDDNEWDFDEEEDDGLKKGDYVIFLPNPHYTHNNNFAIREVIFIKNSYILIDGYFGNAIDNIIPLKHSDYYKKLYTKKSWDLKIGDFFFEEEYNKNHHYVYIVTNIKMGGVICNIQPLNYDGAMIREKFILHGEILVPDKETKKIIQKKIDRIKKGR